MRRAKDFIDADEGKINGGAMEKIAQLFGRKTRLAVAIIDYEKWKQAK